MPKERQLFEAVAIYPDEAPEDTPREEVIGQTPFAEITALFYNMYRTNITNPEGGDRSDYYTAGNEFARSAKATKMTPKQKEDIHMLAVKMIDLWQANPNVKFVYRERQAQGGRRQPKRQH
jgi:hypothetical protein